MNNPRFFYFSVYEPREFFRFFLTVRGFYHRSKERLVKSYFFKIIFALQIKRRFQAILPCRHIFENPAFVYFPIENLENPCQEIVLVNKIPIMHIASQLI